MAAGVGERAEAAPQRIRFHVEPKRYAEALLDIAQQANVTLIGAGACEGVSHQELAGAMTLEEALSQVLAGAPCRWRLVAAGTVEITPLPPAAHPLQLTTVSELLVTATKRNRDPRQLAVAVTALPQGQLFATGAVDIDEAAGQLPGVLATNLGPGRNKLILRGVSDGAYTGKAKSTVATYLDDLPLNYNAPDPDLRLVDVERVEVARGPQGALYGSGSMSGIYRIVSNKPDLEDWSAEVRATGAKTQGGSDSYAVEGYVNLAPWNDVLGLRLSGYDEVQGGYLDDLTLGKDNVDRTKRVGARAMLTLQPGDDWSISLTAAGQHLRSDNTHYTTPGMGLKRNVRIAEPHVNDIEFASATIKKSWSWGELTSSTGYVRHAYGSLYDATSTQQNYTDFAKTSAYSERSRTRMIVQDLVLTSRGASRLEWLAGAYGAATNVHSPTEFLAQNPNLPNVPVYSDDRYDRIREFALYGEVSYEVAPKWTLAVGGRAFNIQNHTFSHVESERFFPRTVDRGADLTGISPKISIQREFDGGDLAYAVISEGYRAGGINSGGALPLPASRETFGADHLVNAEVGLKLRALENHLAVDSAAFYEVWTGIQSDQFRTSGIPYTTNAGDARILGVESELAYRWDFGLTAQLNGRLSYARTSHPNTDFQAKLANGLPGAPAVSAGALLTYQRAVGPALLKLVAETNYVGKSRVTFDTTYPKMGGYARTKLLAEVSVKRVGVQLFVTNPFNSFSDTFAFGNPFNPDQLRQVTPQRPRTVGMTLFASF